jgi:hypothetical protein
MTEFSFSRFDAAVRRLAIVKTVALYFQVPEYAKERDALLEAGDIDGAAHLVKAVHDRAALPWALVKILKRLERRGHTVMGVDRISDWR